uniref:Elements of external origin n=1 Tax=Ralstonia solanacearum TaxID=305 RepID=A0A0S4VUM8_RALSL|nr:protein of unknown function [Ralstonia solanacearum]CUV38260.1 protein of unknown function [Ralstonia solanacearum]CUV62047.1 protein of unknown function [Ralstonia solanacearum]
MGISIRAYARHRGVSDAAVRKAIAAGRITPEAGGTIDTDRADAEWARNTEAPRTGTGTRPVRAAVPQEGGQTQDGPTSSPTGGTSLLPARTVNEVVKAQTNRCAWPASRASWWTARRPSPTSSSWHAPSAMRG